MRPARPILLAALVWATPALARTIEVGPARAIASPAAAVAQAGEGDTIVIDEGEYYECLRPRMDGLTIEGSGAGAVFTDTTCDGKAIIVVAADRLTLRNLTLQRARVGDGNGAGIRAEGRRLTIENLRFLNNQAGLISTSTPAADITIADSAFTDTGRCDGGTCAGAISVGAIARLRIERTRFSGTIGAHQIISAAARTEIIGSTIEDGTRGAARFQVVIPPGGSLLLEDSTIQKGPRAADLRGAILLDGTMSGPVTLRRNRYINETGHPVPFVLDWSDTAPQLAGNTIQDGDTAVSTSGVLAHRAIGLARDTKDALRAAASTARHSAAELYRKLRGY